MNFLPPIHALLRWKSWFRPCPVAPDANVLGILILPFALALYSPMDCWRCHVGEWLDMPAEVGSADAIVVLGGGRERLPVAVQLFQAGLAPEIWATGASEEGDAVDTVETQWLYQTAIEMGIPSDAITLLATTSTWTDGEEIAATTKARGTQSIIVVTSWYHGRRALCAIHHHLDDKMVEVYYQPVETPGFGPDNWWLSEADSKTVTTELYKIIFYWGYYGLVPWVC